MFESMIVVFLAFFQGLVHILPAALANLLMFYSADKRWQPFSFLAQLFTVKATSNGAYASFLVVNFAFV